MKKLLLLSFCVLPTLVMGAQKSEPKTITLPSAENINTCLCSKGFDDFVERTEIGEQLGKKELLPRDIALIIGTALSSYNQHIKAIPDIAIKMQKAKTIIFECILKDFPDTITELTKLKIIEK